MTMVLGLVAMASFAAGWGSGVGRDARGGGRLLWAFPLGAASLLACFLLVSLLGLGPLLTALVGTAVAAAYSWFLGRFRYPWQVTVTGLPLLVLFFLASAVGWLSMVGGCQLDPPREFLLSELPRIVQWMSQEGGVQHPLGAEADFGMTRFAQLAALGGDPWRSALLLSGTAQVLTVLSCLTLLWSWNRRAPLAIALASLTLFLGSPEGWLVSRTPWEGVAHLLLISALGFCHRRPLHALPLLGGLSVFSPHWALATAAALWVRLPRNLWVGLAGLCLGVAQGGGFLGLAAAAALVWRHPHRLVRALCVAEFILPGLFGLAALALAWGRFLTLQWRRYPPERLTWSRVSATLTVPRRLLLGGVAIASLWMAMAAGEEVFNDDILIASQKQKVKATKLVMPDSLQDWVGWRGERYGVSATDLEAVAELRSFQGPLLYLTGEHAEKVEVAALLSALAGGRELAGWYVGADGAALLPAAGAVAATGRADWLKGTPVRGLLWRGQAPLVVESAEASLAVNPGALAQPIRYERWGRLRWYAAPEGSRYQVFRNGVPFGPDLGVTVAGSGEVPFWVPSLPGSYSISWPGLSAQGQISIEVDSELSSLPIEAELLQSAQLPSRSLLPLTFKLINESDVQLQLEDLQGARLCVHSLTGKPDRQTPVTPLPGFTLAPREEKEIGIFLRTPIPPDRLQVSLELLDSQGFSHPVRLREGALVRTWNRRPPLTLPEAMLRHTP